MLSWLNRFRRNRSGVAAVEFAFIAPILAAASLGLADVGSIVTGRMDMHSAVRTGAQYLMNGGKDLDVAKNLVLSSWTSRPTNGYVVANHFCMCATNLHACDALCDDGSIPESYIQLQAYATLEGLFADSSQAARELIRIR